MKQEQFKKLETMLYKRGYHKYTQHWHHEDYVIGKGFHKEDNQWDDDRTAYQILFSVYDYSNKNYPQLTEEQRKRIGVEVHIDVSRIIDERIELFLPFEIDDATIGEIEKKAESFYKWVCRTWKEPKEVWL